MTVKAVIFDFYGTLAETRDWGPSWEELVAELGYTLPPDVRERWWNDGIDGTEHDEHSRSRDHYVAWQQTRVRSMLGECGVRLADQDLLIGRVREISGHRLIEAYPEVPDVLRELRARGYVLAICSNWDWDLHEALDSAGLAGTVDLVISSAWVGARKPHPRIYTHTLQKLEIAPDEVLFVGDTWSCDIEGPLAAGMHTVYVRREHFGPDKTAAEPNHGTTVHRSPDLTPILNLAQHESHI